MVEMGISPTLHLSPWPSWECWWEHGRVLDYLCQGSLVYRYPGRYADVQGTFQRGASGDDAGSHTGPVLVLFNTYVPDFFAVEGF